VTRPRHDNRLQLTVMDKVPGHVGERAAAERALAPGCRRLYAALETAYDLV